MKFKLEQSSVKLLRFKSLFIDKSLRQVVFELCSSEKSYLLSLRQCLSLFGIKKGNLHLQAPTSKGIIYYAFAGNLKQVSSRCKVFTIRILFLVYNVTKQLYRPI